MGEYVSPVNVLCETILYGNRILVNEYFNLKWYRLACNFKCMIIELIAIYTINCIKHSQYNRRSRKILAELDSCVLLNNYRKIKYSFKGFLWHIVLFEGCVIFNKQTILESSLKFHN